MNLAPGTEHPFAEFIRILGKGKRGARHLTREEAARAMTMMLDGAVEPAQLGAFLMLLRHKEESADELTGFTEAARRHVCTAAIDVDLDWPTYAGKKRHLPWYLLAAKALAASGVRIFMHGAGAHTAGRLYSEMLLERLGITACEDWQAVGLALEQSNLAYSYLGHWAPELQRMIELRSLMGLRSPIHTLARLLNPLSAQCVLQGIFHPGYQVVHQQASHSLGDTTVVIKGEGGEFEVRPDGPCLLLGSGPDKWEETWAARLPQRQVKPAHLAPDHLCKVWNGDASDPYGEQAVIVTMAAALRGLGMSHNEALEEAARRWEQRHVSR